MSNSNVPTRKPLGKPLDFSGQALEDLITITETDKQAANRLWQAEAPVAYKNLLLASKAKNGIKTLLGM